MTAYDIEIGTKVTKWNDKANAEFQGNERIYEVVDIITDDAVLIADEYGEEVVFIGEIKEVAQ